MPSAEDTLPAADERLPADGHVSADERVPADKLDLASKLNPSQYEAAATTEGPLLVLAGAGSGKTRVLVYRIAHLIAEKRAWPSQILAVTFTNKAAGEMRTRLQSLVGDEIRRAWIGTFHSMCGRILRQEGHRLGYEKNFSIYDTDDSRRIIKRIMDEFGIGARKSSGVSVAGVASEIERAKNKGLSPEQLKKIEVERWHLNAIAARKVYPRYRNILKKANAVDFADMLYLAVELLKHHPEARDRFQQRFKYVMVDEFQDTNAIQYDFLKVLVEPHHNLAVVGDDDQAIYRWRGADVKNILEFQSAYKDAKVVKLEQNYRSSANILTAANAVISKNAKRHQKALFTEQKEGLPIGLAMLNYGDEEAWLIAETIAARVQAGESANDFAILYRQNAQSRPFEQAFKRARVPYVLIGSTGFFDRMEVKDILAYLRLIANPASAGDFERIINVPSRTIGAKTVEKLREAADAAGKSGLQVLELDDAALNAVGVKGKTLDRLRKFKRLIDGLRELADDATATEVAKEVIAKTRYHDHLEKQDPSKAEDRGANIEELVSSIAEHEVAYREQLDLADDEEPETLAGARTPLEAFLDEAALTATSDVRSEEGSVSLLTLHAAKGLEFPVVFLPGMEDETFPLRRAMESDDPDDLEEERRLCYVGFTRAMRELNLSCVRTRTVYGQTEVRRPSRFLGDLPDAIVTNFGRGPAPKASRYGQTEVRGADVIEYDDPFIDDEIVPTNRQEPSSGGGFRPGRRVIHNTFGDGVVERVDGTGPRAHLTIRFPTVGTKRVVARFVRAADDT